MADETQTGLGPVATRVIFENDDVKVWEMELAPGELCAMHRHTMDYVLYILEGAPLGVESPDGKPFPLKMKPRATYFIPAGGVESARNIGQSRFREVLIEIKRPARADANPPGFCASEAVAGQEPAPGALTILENERMRVSELTLAPGARTEPRRFPHDAVLYVAEGSGVTPRGEIEPAGGVRWIARGASEEFVNGGASRYRHVMVELR